MTVTFKQIGSDKYHISINQDKYSYAFRVRLCRVLSGNEVTLDKEYFYDTYQKANRRYNQLVKKYIYGWN